MKRLALALALIAAAPASAAPNAFSQQLLAMSPVARITMFRQYMNSAKKTCDGIQRVFFQGTNAAGLDLWNVQCEKNIAWAVELAANGKTRIHDCGIAAGRGVPCFAPLAKTKAGK